ncbi:unnamed protein product [Calypogeia fissa]
MNSHTWAYDRDDPKGMLSRRTGLREPSGHCGRAGSLNNNHQYSSLILSLRSGPAHTPSFWTYLFSSR